ncbi:hypothetical protein PGB90_000598 [Kerria lacca]
MYGTVFKHERDAYQPIKSKKIGPYSDAVHTAVIRTASLLYTQTPLTYAMATNVST